MRKVDTTKKSNIKCEHCKNFDGNEVGKCKLTDEKKFYYNRCKKFEWKSKIIEDEKKGESQ